MLTSSGLSGSGATFALGGVVAGLSGLTAGKSYYWDANTRQLVLYWTPYSVGYAFSSTIIQFNPSPAYVPVV